MFPVKKLLHVEMLRDGGSLTAKFEIDGGRQFILAMKIAETLRVWHAPELIDPEKRYMRSELSGESVPVAWAEARQALSEMSALVSDLDPIQAEWLCQMIEVAQHEGRPTVGARKG